MRVLIFTIVSLIIVDLGSMGPVDQKNGKQSINHQFHRLNQHPQSRFMFLPDLSNSTNWSPLGNLFDVLKNLIDLKMSTINSFKHWLDPLNCVKHKHFNKSSLLDHLKSKLNGKLSTTTAKPDQQSTENPATPSTSTTKPNNQEKDQPTTPKADSGGSSTPASQSSSAPSSTASPSSAASNTSSGPTTSAPTSPSAATTPPTTQTNPAPPTAPTQPTGRVADPSFNEV